MRAIVAVALLLGVAGLSSCAEFVLKTKTEETSPSTQCSICQLSAAQMQVLLKKDKMQKELRAVAQLTCSQLATELESTCSAYVDAHFQKAIDFLLQHEPTTVCSKLNQCGDSATSHPATSSGSHDIRSVVEAFSRAKVGADECATCKAFYAAFMKYVTDPSFVNSVVNLVTSDVCPSIAKEFPECSDFATRYVPLIFSLIQQVSPDAVCGFIGLCSQKSVAAAVQDDCSDCTTFIADIQKRFSDPDQQQELADVIAKQACPLLSTVFPQCATYAEEYVPIALQMLEGIAPSDACKAIGWCSGSAVRSAAALFHTFVKLVNDHAQSVKSSMVGDFCADCQIFITDAQKRYADPKQQQVIIDLVVNQACPLLSNVFPQCATYAAQYIPIGFSYLESFAPTMVCQMAGFCVSKSTSTSRVSSWYTIAAAKRVGDSCNDCQQFIGEAQQFYSDPNNQQKLLDLVTNTLCPLASSVFPECVQFAQDEIPQLFNLILSVDPNTICDYIGLCGGLFRSVRAQKKPLQYQAHRPVPHVSQPNDICSDCPTFFTDLQQYFSDPNNVQRVSDELVNEVCPLVSQDFPECTQVVPQYLPVVFQAFESLDPSVICSALGICDSPSFAAVRSLINVLTSSKVGQAGAAPPSYCAECEIGVQLLRGVLKSNATVNEIIATVLQVCNIVAEAGRPMCQAMLDAVVREVLYTLDHATNQQVCATFLSQCASPTTSQVKVKQFKH